MNNINLVGVCNWLAFLVLVTSVVTVTTVTIWLAIHSKNEKILNNIDKYLDKISVYLFTQILLSITFCVFGCIGYAVGIAIIVCMGFAILTNIVGYVKKSAILAKNNSAVYVSKINRKMRQRLFRKMRVCTSILAIGIFITATFR